MRIKHLKEIEITNDDIIWVEDILNNEIHFDDERVKIIKNLDSVDIQAFPGSGKTTVLVAKLAILARKWTYTNSGICVLSHTNVAREEIEKRLGRSEVGKALLSYPHFIGTLHSFFDTYVAIPWLRSKGFDISCIDTEYVHLFRWNKLSKNIQYALKKRHCDESICSYEGNIGEINWDKNGETKMEILNVIQNTQKDGYFTFNEMLLYTKQALEECEGISLSIQQRFPVLFIDEAQDTDTFQWNLLHQAFNKDSELSIRQGYGDSNQAIYSNLLVDDKLKNFPRYGALVLSQSKRFDSRIAKLANTVALTTEQMEGTNNIFGERSIEHTIFLFEKDKALQVINEYGQLILNTFSEQELNEYKKEGCHAIGVVHDKKEETSQKHFPKGIYDYWKSYEAKKNKKNDMPPFLIEYFRYGIVELKKSEEKSEQIEWITKGLIKLINKGKGYNYITFSKNCISNIIRMLPEESKKEFRKILYELADVDNIISKTDWVSMVDKIKKILKMFDITNDEEIKKFGKWVDEDVVEILTQDNDEKPLPNHYIYTDIETKRSVDIEFGSIHSVKGKTHLATLVLETYSRTHNMKSILNFLCNNNIATKKIKNNEKRLKCQYVAMTRARALICLALPIDFVNDKMQLKLQEMGWKIRKI